MEQEEVVLLLQATTLLQSVVHSCIDRKQFPFTKSQMNIFTVLGMEGEVTMKQAAQHLSISQEQATRAVAPLVNTGYVERRIYPANRTRVYISLTESGRQLMEDLRLSLTENLSAKLEQSLSEEDNAVLCRAVSDVVRLTKTIQ